jgi:hypothetical protein
LLNFRPVDARVGLALMPCRVGGCSSLFGSSAASGLAWAGLELVHSCPVTASGTLVVSALVAIGDLGWPRTCFC